MDYLSRDEILADLSITLSAESKILLEQLGVEVTFNEPAKTPIGQDFDLLHHYIYKRVWKDAAPAADPQHIIHRVIGFLDRIERADNWEITGGFTVSVMKSHARLQLLADTVEAYRCLDDGEAITLSHAELLTGMSTASIRNAASRGDISIHHNTDTDDTYVEDGQIQMETWLTSRTGYRQPPKAPSAITSQTVLVPFAADGSYFSPACRMRKGYHIGKRGGKGVMAQRYISDYWRTLSELQKMKKPYWRRPSPTSGVPGTVIGRSWGNIDRATLEGQLRET